MCDIQQQCYRHATLLKELQQAEVEPNQLKPDLSYTQGLQDQAKACRLPRRKNMLSKCCRAQDTEYSVDTQACKAWRGA